jgi:hypothetical protein
MEYVFMEIKVIKEDYMKDIIGCLLKKDVILLMLINMCWRVRN